MWADAIAKTGLPLDVISYTKSDPIAPFWLLVVETFRLNVCTKFCGLPKKGVAD